MNSARLQFCKFSLVHLTLNSFSLTVFRDLQQKPPQVSGKSSFACTRRLALYCCDLSVQRPDLRARWRLQTPERNKEVSKYLVVSGMGWRVMQWTTAYESRHEVGEESRSNRCTNNLECLFLPVPRVASGRFPCHFSHVQNRQTRQVFILVEDLQSLISHVVHKPQQIQDSRLQDRKLRNVNNPTLKSGFS